MTLLIIKKVFRIIQKEGILFFLRKFVFTLYYGFTLYYWVRIKKFNSENVEELINFTFNECGNLIKPSQIPAEISQLLKILKERKPKMILEIGTAGGGTLFCFCKVAHPEATIISIDLPGGQFGGGYLEWRIPLYRSFINENQKMYLLRKDSHQQKTLEEVKKILNGNLLDFLFIDGDHSYEGVKKDFEMYGPLVRKNGIIALHDIAVHPPETQCLVHNFWEEIKNQYRYAEIIKDRNQKWAGIGILFIQ